MSELDTAGAGIMGRRRRGKKTEEAAADGEVASTDAGSESVNVNVAIAKMAKDMAELELPRSVTMTADKKDNYLKFSLFVKPETGYWAGGSFEFQFEIPATYPWGAPVVTCVDPIWHPNIDLQGKPCVNVLQKNWKPVFSIQTVVFAILFLFTDPNPQDPLNVEAADEMRLNANDFRGHVNTALKGGSFNGHTFPGNKGGTPALFGKGRI